MSGYSAIRAATLTLRDLLRDRITLAADPELNGFPVDLRSPKEMREADVQGLSLWLYQVVRNGDLLNRPPERLSLDQRARAGIPLNLYYLLTPIAGTSDDEQLILGRILQTFQDRATLRGATLRDSLEGSDVELRVSLERLDLESLTRVWDSLKEPYQLSLSYLVQAVTIHSDRQPEGLAPVLSSEGGLVQIKGAT